jgi:hypothetical protein
MLCNRTGSTVSFSVAADGDGLGAPTLVSGLEKFIYYDVDIATKDAFASTIGLALYGNDSEALWVSGTNGLSCTLFGAEIA